jgi:acyl-CoA synthetase (NDP forming)
MTSVRRGVYRHGDLRRALEPKSVAVIGASPSATSVGARTVKQLELLGFGGPIHLVNSRYEQVGERRCYPSVKALPEVPDCVIATVGREAVEEVLRDPAEAGAGGAIIFAAGFSETGKAERIAEQDRITAIGREANMRIIGPNCFGAINYLAKSALTFGHTPSFKGDPAAFATHDRRIGLVSQSGGLGFAAIQALERGVLFSHVLTSGNSCDVDVADLVAYLADDPGCKSIACIFEGMANPERLLEAAEIACKANKPIVINKLGTGEQGAAAAVSHSGTLAGSRAAYMAAFERAGMIVVDNYEHVVETASFMAKARPSSSRGVVVLTSSGGASVMSADKAEIHNVPMPQPTEPVRALLESKLPDFGTARNPCDVTGGVNNDLETYFALVDALLGDPSYDMLLTAHPFSVHTVTRVKGFAEKAAKHNKIVNNVFITEFLTGNGYIEAERDPNLTVFRSMDRCFATIGAWYRREDRRKAEAAAKTVTARASNGAAAGKAAPLIAASPNRTLTEREAKAVLAAYDVPVVEEALTTSADDAATAAARIGFPVALKVESPDIPHKTEAGVIRLDLRDEAAVRQAFDAVMANARKAEPNARLNGVLVQPMIAAGVEIMVGGRIDPVFGPLILVGTGGILVELLKDSVVDLAPVTVAQARSMLDRLKSAPLLAGYRGSAPVDRDKLAGIVARLSEFIADNRDAVAELDVNPLICSAGRIVAVDALIAKPA